MAAERDYLADYRARKAAQAAKRKRFRLTLGPKVEGQFGGWKRTAALGERSFYCYVEQGRRVRIPFKPRGTYGFTWVGSVYENHRRIWSDTVLGSTGAWGLLDAAGVFDDMLAAEQNTDNPTP